jgi:hypothetical protein
LARDTRIEADAHFANMQVIVTLRAFILPGEW